MRLRRVDRGCAPDLDAPPAVAVAGARSGSSTRSTSSSMTQIGSGLLASSTGVHDAVDISNACTYRAVMAPDPRIPAEWAVELRIDDHWHRVTVVARGHDGVETSLGRAAARKTRTHYTVADSDRMLTVDWANVEAWEVGEIEFRRTWGPGSPWPARLPQE
jgi:hypothetical protein